MSIMNVSSQTIIQQLKPSLTGDGPWALILVGLPGSGKTTFVDELLEGCPTTHIASTDNLLEAIAKERGITYTEAFSSNTVNLQTKMLEEMDNAIKEQKNIIVDQTNMSIKSRMGKIVKLVKSNYEVFALVFDVDDQTLQERLKSRANLTGKVIPQHVMETMAKSYQEPSKAEGFTLVIKVPQ